jgi:hypothetical protein
MYFLGGLTFVPVILNGGMEYKTVATRGYFGGKKKQTNNVHGSIRSPSNFHSVQKSKVIVHHSTERKGNSRPSSSEPFPEQHH